MAYHALDHNTAIDYLRALDTLDHILDVNADLQAKEVGDGNLNLVFIIENADNPTQSVVLKQALPYLRVAGATLRVCCRTRPALAGPRCCGV